MIAQSKYQIANHNNNWMVCDQYTGLYTHTHTYRLNDTIADADEGDFVIK